MCVLVLSTFPLFIRFSIRFGNCSDCMVFFFLLYCIGQHEWTFGIAQCGFLGSITKVIAIGERTKHWSNRECQNKYNRTVKLKVKCLKTLEKEPKNSLAKMINEYKTRLFEKVKLYPSIRRVFLSMQNQLEVGCLLDTYIFSCIMRRLLSM